MLLPDDPIEDTLTVFIIVIPISKIQFQKRLQTEVPILIKALQFLTILFHQAEKMW